MAGKQKSSRGRVKGRGRRWVSRVRTESTYPPKGLFTKSALTIARSLASKRVSPKGPRSGMRMLTYFINRAGHELNTRGVERNSKGPRPCFQSESERREQGRAGNSRRDSVLFLEVRRNPERIWPISAPFNFIYPLPRPAGTVPCAID